MRVVREVRDASGLTQTDFANKIGKTLSTVQRYEGIVPPTSMDTLAHYAEIATEFARLDLRDLLIRTILAQLSPQTRAVLEAHFAANRRHQSHPALSAEDEIYVTKLREVLASTDTLAKDAVTKNIDLFRDRLRPDAGKRR